MKAAAFRLVTIRVWPPLNPVPQIVINQVVRGEEQSCAACLLPSPRHEQAARISSSTRSAVAGVHSAIIEVG